MKKLSFIYHDDYLKHDTGALHPEKPDRLRAILDHLKNSSLWNDMKHVTPTPASIEWIEKVHPRSYIEMIERRCRAGERTLDEGDTHACIESYDVALLAAGAVLNAVDIVASEIDTEKKSSVAFCAVRPPGHHAETSTVMGFCLFNNVAIGARYARMKLGIERVSILDWDVHHGNGTQEIFYADPTVQYISLHQYPFYPGTGATTEIGTDKGKGFTINCPMAAGSGEREYLQAFEQKVLPALHSFQPQLIFISAGFDAHRDDPLAQIHLTEESFAKMTAMVMEIAAAYCAEKIISVLEGGYNLHALAKSVGEHLRVLTGDV